MTTYLITRHPGALEWLNSKVSGPVVHLSHLSQIELIKFGDTVVGTLPVNLVEVICRHGARYLHLTIEIPQALRGQELTAQQLSELDATLREYIVIKPCDDIMRSAVEREDGV